MSAIPDLRIAQGLLHADARGGRVVALSDGFEFAEAERVAVLFGTPPPGVACPRAHFACPFGADRVAVVQVADHSPGRLAFRFLILARELYRHLGDPFQIADRYPPNWDTTGTLPELAWPMEVLPRRTVAQIQGVLKHADAGKWMDLLLGGTQALLDGGRVLVRRDAPDEDLLRSLWQLLPDRTRCDLWPASFAFTDELGFHAAALPVLPPDPRGLRHTEDGLRDYPPGRYELGLQIAAEGGDQRELDRLFARRTSSETLRLGLYMIAAALVVAAAVKFVL
ncbi:MAG: hypothetical protein K2P78_11025 [Gemmataceae bacterium]|nr:hypothetical protein [Gemmataceae bacterium]